MSLAASALEGNRLALSRLLSQVENGSTEGREALSELFQHTGQAHLVGVTGASGTGKSSLVNQLALFYRHPPAGEKPRRVAVVAVDPSSPFSGGAFLGDRVRMRDLAGDPGIFIRSMASRGSLGGLANATAGFVQVLDAAGFEIILVETVGAGQDEVDIARLAHTTIVVEAPGLGDDIQAIKAGILEIADILVINKADRPGVENTERALRNMLELAHPVSHPTTHHGQTDSIAASTPPPADQQAWIPPILRTVALEGTGIQELGKALEAHAQHLKRSGDWQRRERLRLESELETLIQVSLVARWRENVSDQVYQDVLTKIVSRSLSPLEAAEALLNGRNNRY